MQAPWPGSPLQAAQAAEVDMGLGSGGGIEEGTGFGTVAGKGEQKGGAVEQKTEEVEERENKMEVGDSAD